MGESNCNDVTLFFNCRLLRHYNLVRDELWVKNGKIINPIDVKRHADKKIDCYNCIISPGFIDLQVNGAFGVDFLTHPDLPEGLNYVNKKLPSTGVTSYAPTLITSPSEYFHRTLPLIQIKNGSSSTGAGVIGVHCEGPFINPEKKGAHPIECIVDFGTKGFQAVEDMYGDLTNIKIVTLAPEYEGAEYVIKELTKKGIIVSLGHSNASLHIAEKAVKAGARKITHLFNAMPAFHHRDPSLPGLLCSQPDCPNDTVFQDNEDSVFFGLIADGIHTHTAALRIAYKLSPNCLILVTDALAPMGLPCGEYRLGKTNITVSGSPKTAKVTGSNTLCGCVATMDFCVRNFKKVVGCSTAYALTAATLHPAQCMRMTSSKGTLEFGTDADFILIDDDINVLYTYISGELTFTNLKKLNKYSFNEEESIKDNIL